MKRIVLVFIIVLMTFTVAACSGNSGGASAPANALYFDNFSESASGWTRVNNEAGVSDYAKGYFHILINKASTLLIANPGKTFEGDVSIDVDAHKIGGSDDNYYGVVCHYKDPNNYYIFMITSDGYAGIGMRKDGEYSVISAGLKFLKMEGIKKGRATNHIRVDCIGEKLVLYTNGKQVNLAYNDMLTGGDVGVAVLSGRLEGGTDISFDNFTVFKPAQP